MPNPVWTDAMVKDLCASIANGDTYTQIAKRLGFTRSKVAGAVYRHILGGDRGPRVNTNAYWAARLFEPYAVRKARRLNAKTPTTVSAATPSPPPRE